MSWNALIRQTHRWLSLAFMAAVIANIVALVLGSQATWLGLLALVPLLPLMATGAYLFVRPYVGRRKA